MESAEKEDAARKPLVVIVEGVEGVDPLLLQDLILVLSEVRHCNIQVHTISSSELSLDVPMSCEVFIAQQNIS